MRSSRWFWHRWMGNTHCHHHFNNCNHHHQHHHCDGCKRHAKAIIEAWDDHVLTSSHPQYSTFWSTLWVSLNFRYITICDTKLSDPTICKTKLSVPICLWYSLLYKVPTILSTTTIVQCTVWCVQSYLLVNVHQNSNSFGTQRKCIFYNASFHPILNIKPKGTFELRHPSEQLGEAQLVSKLNTYPPP